MVIVHISTDYPDCYEPAKTQAIANLISATSHDFDHLVYSLNRENISPTAGLKRWLTNDWAGAVKHHGQNDNVINWIYSAPSHGLFLRSSLQQIGREIANDLQKRGVKPDLIQGHKLTMEGIIAESVAQAFNVPYALSIQGNTDRYILNVRRDLWPIYRRIFHNAKAVFPFTPWAFQYCEQRLGARKKPSYMLPCITNQDQIIPPQIRQNRIMSAFHLRHWRIKNFHKLVAAAASVERKFDDFAFDIYGGGSEELQADLRDDIVQAKSQSVTLCGAIPGQDIQMMMNDYAGFAMVSKRETYGMVFAEALLAGCPIIYPEDAAVDGYFDGKNFALAVPANDSKAISKAMVELIEKQESIKKDLAHWQESGDAAQFQREAITRQYRDGLIAAVQDGANDAD